MRHPKGSELPRIGEPGASLFLGNKTKGYNKNFLFRNSGADIWAKGRTKLGSWIRRSFILMSAQWNWGGCLNLRHSSKNLWARLCYHRINDDASGTVIKVRFHETLQSGALEGARDHNITWKFLKLKKNCSNLNSLNWNSHLSCDWNSERDFIKPSNVWSYETISSRIAFSLAVSVLSLVSSSQWVPSARESWMAANRKPRR